MVIIGTNNKLDRFIIRPKSDIEREIINDSNVLSPTEGCYAESEIISMIGNGYKFYTYFNKKFTDVSVVNNHLRSVANDTMVDNLKLLPKVIFD